MTLCESPWAVLENPHDLTPRRVAADWYQERGFEDTADFVRAACDLAEIPPEPAGPVCHAAHQLGYGGRCRRPTCVRCRWADEHFGRYDRLSAVVRRAEQADGENDPAGRFPFPEVANRRYEAGFVSFVDLRLHAFMRIAQALFAAAPITAVNLWDCEPALGSTWFAPTQGSYEPFAAVDVPRRRNRLQARAAGRLWAGNQMDLGVIPRELWELLPPADRGVGTLAKAYAEETAAYQALSDACVRYGRNLNNLPGLVRAPTTTVRAT